jgi:hypothetical protein
VPPGPPIGACGKPPIGGCGKPPIGGCGKPPIAGCGAPPIGGPARPAIGGGSACGGRESRENGKPAHRQGDAAQNNV